MVRRHFFGAAVATLAGLDLTMNRPLAALLRGPRGSAHTPLSALRGATTWINSPALGERELNGKVVLVNFCTYTCINWLRQLPHVRAWAGKYRDNGLVVIGVHTPEFSFEHGLENVRRNLAAVTVAYPVAVDNEYAIWNGFGNQYWPAIYLIDAMGKVRHTQFGEGGYEDTERMIQQLLRDAGAENVDRTVTQVAPRGIEAPADWNSLASQENYLGSARTEHFVATIGPSGYGVPARLGLNDWGLIGDWTVSEQSVALNRSGGKIVTRFHARDLHLVLAPTAPGGSVHFRVQLDGEAPGTAHGGDIAADGIGSIVEPRLYQLIRHSGRVMDRDFAIEFLDGSVEGFAFTFG